MENYLVFLKDELAFDESVMRENLHPEIIAYHKGIQERIKKDIHCFESILEYIKASIDKFGGENG